MSYQLSKHDINFLRHIFKYGNVIGVLPSYDFDKNLVTNPKRDKCVGAIVIIVHTIWMIVELQQALHRMIPIIDSAIAYISHCAFYLFIVSTILNCCLFNNNNWAKLLTNFQLLDEKLNNRGLKEKRFYCRVYLQFLVSNLVHFSMALYISLVFKEKILNNLFPIFSFYYCLFFQFFVCQVLTAFNLRYIKLIGMLREYYIINITSAFNKIVDHRNNHTLSEIEENLKSLKLLVGSFNKIFGWPLFFLLGVIICKVLVILTSCVHGIIRNASNDEGKSPIPVMLMGFYLIAILLVPTVITIFLCDNVSQKCNEIELLCYNYMDSFAAYSKERKELCILAEKSRIYSVKFNAANFFNVQKSNLLGMVATITTHIIIIVQLMN